MKAYELLANKKRWVKLAFAVNHSGLPVDARHPNAVAWCMDGALSKCYASYLDYLKAKHKLEDVILSNFLVYYNPDEIDEPVHLANDADETIHEKVIEWLRRADV